MKKVLVSAILATGMVVSGSAMASAATKVPQASSIKKPVATHKIKVKSATKAKTTHKKVSKKKIALVVKKK